MEKFPENRNGIFFCIGKIMKSWDETFIKGKVSPRMETLGTLSTVGNMQRAQEPAKLENKRATNQARQNNNKG